MKARARTIASIVSLVVILTLVFAPLAPTANGRRIYCGKQGCNAETRFSSITYALLGVGGVYDSNGSYYLGSPWTSASTGWIYYSPVSPSGLRFVMTLNATTVEAGGAIRAQVFVMNTLKTNVSVSPSPNQNITYWLGDETLCQTALTTYLFGFAVYRGHYTASNISTAGRPLSLGAPLFLECPSGPFPSELVYLPNSDVAAGFFNHPLPYLANGSSFTVAGNITTQTCTLSGCGLGTSLFGYWNSSTGSYTEPNSQMLMHLVKFQLGEYTIVAGDAWNQTLYAAFDVI